MARRAPMLLLAAAIAVAVAHAAPLNDLKVFGYDPQAHASHIIVSGNARFTILSEHVIRYEYSAAGTFEDRATLAIVNRKTPTVSFTQKTTGGQLEIKTPKVTLYYTLGQTFSSTSLTAQAANGVWWHHGDIDDKNLLGTVKSLDELCTVSLNCTVNANTIVHQEHLHCAWGVVSRNGWTIIDDTKNYIMSSVEGQWFNNSLRSVSDVDGYFFGHGMQYREALQDLNLLSGRQPLTNRALLGSWYTRWYDYDNDNIERLLDLYEKTNLPLDVLVLDMNWHTKHAWTGYSWDRQVFPVPNATIDLAHARGLVIAANLHDAEGIGNWEDKYDAMCSVMGQNPSDKEPVLFQPLNATYMHALEDIVLPNAGFDVWWIDWQQGGQVGGCAGEQMNPTFITDHVRMTDAIRRGENKRDNILARWGGLGSQRYPVGFSGDVQSLSWECMAFQPYFSVTAANVGYGRISHDLEGPADDHELHVRWMQFGAFSGVMRIHDRGMSAGSCWATGTCSVVDMWLLPFDYLNPIRDAMNLRVALLPYMYTAERLAYTTGVVMVHPMYYDWPTQPSAYAMGPGGNNAQYMFGDDMFVAPITFPADGTTQLATKSLWVPPGDWYDDVFGEIVRGPTGLTRKYTLADVPRFIRAGAVIPMLPKPQKMGVATQQFTSIDWHIYPGTTNGSTTLYEDDGKTLDYITGGATWSTTSYQWSGQTVTINVGAVAGSFTGMPSARNTRIFLVGVLPLSSATCGGTAASFNRFGGANTFWYDGATATAVVDCGSVSVSTATSVTATTVQPDSSPSITAKAKVYASRTALAKRTLDNVRETPDSTTFGPGYVKRAAARAGHITAIAGSAPMSAVGLMQNYTSILTEALQELGGSVTPVPPGPAPVFRELVQMWDPDRKDMVLCGSQECVDTNQNQYETMWAEGYQPLSTNSNAVPLYDYWNSGWDDNWATTDSSSPQQGYNPAVFSNGYVLGAAASGATCLEVWWNSQTHDHMTTASSQGIQWASSNGYSKVSSCIGYVLTSPPGLGAQPSGGSRILKKKKTPSALKLQDKLQATAATAQPKAAAQDQWFQRAIALYNSFGM